MSRLSVPAGTKPSRAANRGEALVRAIAHQQLHARAAEAILARLLALYPDADFPSPQALLATDEQQQQRACGLSASKLVAIRGIAQAAADGVVPSRADALRLSDDELIAPDAARRAAGRSRCS